MNIKNKVFKPFSTTVLKYWPFKNFTHLNSAQKDPDRVAATYGVGILFQIRGEAFVIKALNNLHALKIIRIRKYY